MVKLCSTGDLTIHHLYALSAEQPLAVETVLRPVLVISEDSSVEQFFPATAGTGAMATRGTSTAVLAQFDDVDILADMVNLWNTFIETGQVWALIIGLVIGYFLRGLTTYS